VEKPSIPDRNFYPSERNAQMPASENLPPNIVGERDTLRALIGEVRQLLTSRDELDPKARQALDTFDHSLTEDALTLAALESLRERLGDIVAQAASRHFADDDFIAWSRGRWEDVGPYDWPTTTQPSRVTASANMPRDAHASPSILLTNTRAQPVRIAAHIQRPVDGPQIVLRRGRHVSCPDRRYRADALILMPEDELTLTPGETTSLWIQLDSHGSDVGRFSVPITLTSEHTTSTTQLEVEVFPVRLPSVLECTLFNFAYVNEMGLIRDLVEDAMSDLRDHSINTYIIPDARPEAEADAQGNLTAPIDFSAVDRGIETYREHARQIGFFWGADINTSLGKLLFPELTFLSAPWRKAVTTWYTAWIRHLEEIGLPSDRYFMYVYDENTSPEVQQVYQLLKETAPDIRLLVNPTSGYDPDQLRAIAKYVDIWMPSYEALIQPHPEDFEFLRSTGRTLWMYSCINGTPMPLYDYYLRRHWVGWDLGVTGIAQWAYADHGGWNSSNSWDWVIGAFATIYTRANAPRELQTEEPIIPSKRWEAWREGSQDAQLLTMARTAASAAPALEEKLSHALSLVLDHPEDPDAADRARVLLLNLLSER